MMSLKGIALFAAVLLTGCTSTSIEPDPEILTASPAENPDGVQIATYPGGWETEIQLKALSRAVLEETRRAFSEADLTRANVETFFDNSFTPEVETCAIEAFEATLFAFEPYLTEDFASRTHYLVSGRGEWLHNTVRELPVSDWPVQNHNGASIGFVAWLEQVIQTTPSSTTFGVSERNAVIVSPGPGFSTSCSQMSRLIYHETFHMVSLQLDGRSLVGYSPEQAEDFGLWFVEGSADFFANTLAANFLKEEYYGVDPKREPGDLKDHSSMFSSQSGKQYSLGNLAVEFIVANVGVEPVMDVYKKIGEGHDFSSAFSLAIGIPIQEFYDLYDSLEIIY